MASAHCAVNSGAADEATLIQIGAQLIFSLAFVNVRLGEIIG